MVPDESPPSAVLTGGWDGASDARPSIGSQRPAAAQQLGEAAAGPWPEWARAQLAAAVEVVATVPDRFGAAGVLYREWFNPVVAPGGSLRRPLAGLYRGAHAGTSSRRRSGGVSVVDRHDVIGTDGWWRTWGESWTPPRTRPGSVRLLLTPRSDGLGELVAVITGRLLTAPVPWSLSCATDVRRINRLGAAVLDLPGPDAIPQGLLAELAPLLHPIAPPLCLPVAPGVGLAEYPDNGMSFGEHRCHLVALALRHPDVGGDALRAIAAVFSAHGIDPGAPYRARP